MIRNIFDKAVVDELVGRIDLLRKDTIPQWGKMNAGQMLAHCCVPFEYVYEIDKFPKPGAFKKMIMKLFIKKMVVTDQPYKRNSMTGPDFLMTTEKDFEAEKQKLVGYLIRTQELGGAHFDGKESLNFGKLTLSEWNIMFYKHLDYHLDQFGV